MGCLPVEDGKILRGKGLEAGRPLDHGLCYGEAVLPVQGQGLVQPDQKYAEDGVLVNRHLDTGEGGRLFLGMYP